MNCHFCSDIATEKHHVRYFPEETIGVCHYHGIDIHKHPEQYDDFIKFNKGDADYFYNQKKRLRKRGIYL